MTVRIALAQQAAGPDIARNLERVLATMEDAKNQGADLFCVPELALVPFFPQHERFVGAADLAEPIPGPTTNKFCELAEKYAKWIIPGSMVEKRGEDFHNTSVLISPEGEVVARYSKMHTWLPLEPFTPGKEFCVFDIPEVGRIGICICYDLWFPEVCRQLAWMGAEVIFHPTMTPASLGAQETVPGSLSLEEAIRIATRNSPLLQADLNNEELANWNIKAAYGSLLSTASAGTSVRCRTARTHLAGKRRDQRGISIRNPVARGPATIRSTCPRVREAAT